MQHLAPAGARRERPTRASRPPPGHILPSKLVPPGLPRRYVARPRLWELLDGARQRPLTLVAASAGAGKTVTLSGWAGRLAPTACGWLSLDADDNDPVRFWTYVAAALEGLVPEVGVEAVDLLSESRDGMDDRAVSSLANDLAAAGPRPDACLVLDDVHVLTRPELRRALAQLTEIAPPWLHLVLGTRADPWLRLHRLRAQGTLLELRQADLAFSADEVHALLRAADIDDLTPEDVALLLARTEGWAAGLQLAALSLQRAQQRSAFVAQFAGTDRTISEFLVGEVLETLPGDVRQFLLDTSFLDVLTPAACDAVTSRDDSGDVLRRLERDNLFVLRLDAAYATFRYHHLFAELLRSEVRSRAPDRERTVHRLVADWYEAHDDVSGAIHHRVAARQYGEAIDLIRAHTRQFYDAGRGATVRAWWQSIPPGQLGGEPWDLVERAVNLPVHAWQEATALLERADDALRRKPDATTSLRLAIFRGAMANVSCQPLEGLVDLDHALGLLADPAVSGDPRVERLPVVPRLPGFLVAAWTMLERFDDAEAAARTPLPPFAEDRTAALYRSATLAERALASGQLDEAERLVERATTLAGALGMPDEHVNMLPVMGTRGGLLRERNRLDEAERLLETVVAMASDEYPRGNRFRLRAIVELARLWSARGRTHEALALLDDAAEESIPSPLGRGWVDAQRALLLASTGRTAKARALLTGLPELPSSALVAAQVSVADGDHVAARRHLSAVPLDNARQVLVGSLVEASMATTGGDGRKATEHLQRAITVGAREGFVRTLLDFDPPIDRLLTMLPVGPVDYVESLAALTTTRVLDLRSPADMVEHLSEREREVLRYLPTRLSSREIASELFVSLNTVKTHLRAIYRKLDAGSRRQAVSRARELRLLR